MAAGELDGNTQTLNDTMFAVAAGGEQTIVVTNDNSTGNDAIICDESVTSIEDLEGKTIAAEAGVVDHFLLLQGLESVGLTEDDIDFRGLLTDAAAAGFADGEFDCVGVFAPFTLTALEREGSHVLFDSADFPGTISDHIVVTPDLIDERPGDVQALVDAWYLTLDYIEDNPEEALQIMADAAELSARGVRELRRRHHPVLGRRRPGRLRGRRRHHVAPLHRPPHQPVPRRGRPDRGGGRPRRPVRRQLHPGLRRPVASRR